MDCTFYVAKTKALISFAVTAKLICVFVFAYAKSRFSHDAALMSDGLTGCLMMLLGQRKDIGSLEVFTIFQKTKRTEFITFSNW